MSYVNNGGRSTQENLVYDPKTGQWVTSTATTDSEAVKATNAHSNSKEVKIPSTQKTGDYSSSADSKTAADKEYIDAEFNILTGEMKLTPSGKSIRIKVNDTVEIVGLGKYLSGLYFVSSVSRNLNNSSGYSQSIHLLKNGFGDSVKSPYTQTETRTEEVALSASVCSVGDSVQIVGEDAVYSNAHNGVKVPGWVKKKTLTVHQISDDGTRARLMPINSWTYLKYIKKV